MPVFCSFWVSSLGSRAFLFTSVYILLNPQRVSWYCSCNKGPWCSGSRNMSLCLHDSHSSSGGRKLRRMLRFQFPKDPKTSPVVKLDECRYRTRYDHPDVHLPPTSHNMAPSPKRHEAITSTNQFIKTAWLFHPPPASFLSDVPQAFCYAFAFGGTAFQSRRRCNG